MRALIFDCDGVLADTERDGHLVAFNQMWREQGVNWQWTLDQYAEKLKIGGGKERIASLGRDADFRAAYNVPASDEAWQTTVTEWHKRKSDLFKQLVMSGALPGRPRPRARAETSIRLSTDWTRSMKPSTSSTPCRSARLRTRAA